MDSLRPGPVHAPDLPADLAEHRPLIDAAYCAGRREAQRAGEWATAARDFGRRLAAVKAAVPHGQWRPALEAVGVNERTAQRRMALAREAEGVADADLAGWLAARSKSDTVSDLALPDGKPKSKLAQALADRAARYGEAARAAETAGRPPNLHVCAVADLHRRVEAGSVDFIVTDPPYGETQTYADLARFAVHALRPGGLVLAMAGNWHMHEAQRRMAGVEGLALRQTVAYFMPGGTQMLHAARTVNRYKPVLVFRRDGAADEYYAPDFVNAGAALPDEKAVHHWGQSTRGLYRLITLWCKPPGSVVCDPFCGAGSTLVAAVRAGHRVVGADLDPAYVETARRALARPDDAVCDLEPARPAVTFEPHPGGGYMVDGGSRRTPERVREIHVTPSHADCPPWRP